MFLSQIFRNRGDKVPDDTKQTQEVNGTRPMAKRTAKNSVFLDLFQDKKNLLKLYKTLHPEDTDATEDTLDIVTIDNVLTDNLYNDLGVMVGNLISRVVEVVTIMMSLFDNEQIMRTYWKDMENTLAHKKDRETAERMIKDGELSLEKIAQYVPALSMDELKELEAEVMQLA